MPVSLIKTAAHAPTRGKDTAIYVALLPFGSRVKPYDTPDETLTIDSATPGSPIAKGATTIPLSAAIPTGVTIAAGQALRFVDTNDREYIAYVNANVVGDGSTTTSLTVLALDEAIPDASVAEFPGYLWDRTDSSVSLSGNLSDVATYNTGDNTDGVVTSFSTSMSLPGLYYHFNEGYHTLKYAAKNGREVWLRKELRSPTDAFAYGEVIEGPAVVTDRSLPSPGDGFVSIDFEVQLLGAITETAPTPT